MSSTHSVTAWLGELKAGQDDALDRLHQRYWPLLVSVARTKLGDTVRRCADEEDVAQAAFWSFYHSLKAGRIPQLNNRRDLLALLTHIVACKAINQIKHEIGVQKRGGGRVQGESIFESGDGGCGIDGVAQEAISPQEQAILNDCYRFYLDRLPDNIRRLAELHLAGLTNKEIARELGCVERTVERKLALLREKWRALAVASQNSIHDLSSGKRGDSSNVGSEPGSWIE
jgi:RNA polymerase sigma factor (sigma-70 family)